MLKEKQAADDSRAPSGYLNTHASTAGKIKPIALPSSNDATTQYLTAEPSTYVDPTPATPITSQPPSRTPSNAARSHSLMRDDMSVKMSTKAVHSPKFRASWSSLASLVVALAKKKS
ncbi:hypothetical protein LB505_005190 [Fusarium chuoi]|nr:hypothetical protein LB505_005190 [Fusarium chuoi]